MSKCDGILDRVLLKSRHMLVPYFLMASYLYYKRDVSLLSDARFDKLCTELDAEWDDVEHRHKHLIDRDALKAGTGFQIADYPNMIIGAACQLAGIPSEYDLAPVSPPVRKKIQFTIKKKAKP